MSDYTEFIYDVVQGVASPDDIENYIEQWHLHSTGNTSLHHYLGMTWDEYAGWVRQDVTVMDIIHNRGIEI